MIFLDLSLPPEPVAAGARRAVALGLLRDGVVLGVLVAAVAIVTGVPWLVSRDLDRRAAELDAARRRHEAASVRMVQARTRVAELEAEQTRLSGTLGTLAALEADRYGWPRFMDAAARSLPRYSWMDAVEMDPVTPGEPVRYRVQGAAPSQADVSRLERALVASQGVGQAALESSGGLEAGPFPLVRFVVGGSLKRSGDTVAQSHGPGAGYNGPQSSSPNPAPVP